MPRGQSLGAAWYLPEERSITTTEQILDQICSALGGRAAEQLVFNKISTGALSDLEKVTKQAYAMVSIYGLNDRIGNISFYDSQGRDMFTKPYSDDTAKIIDEEVSKLIEFQYSRAKSILSENQDKLTLLAERLLTNEVIFKEDLEEIFGKRQWDISSQDEVQSSEDAVIISPVAPEGPAGPVAPARPVNPIAPEAESGSDEIVSDTDFGSTDETSEKNDEAIKPTEDEV